MIVASLATLPERERELKNALESIYPYADKIYVALNKYENKPKWLKESPLGDKIESKILDNSTGDAAKFYFVDKLVEPCYHFVCDDDIVYTKEYFLYMIENIERFKRKALITIQGRIIPKTPIKSYYRKGTLNISRARFGQTNDIQLHIPGTHVLAYHTDTIKFNYADFKLPNMADIWVGIIAQKHRVPIMSLKHDSNLIGYQHVDGTIFRRSYKNDRLQTDEINKINWTFPSL